MKSKIKFIIICLTITIVTCLNCRQSFSKQSIAAVEVSDTIILGTLQGDYASFGGRYIFSFLQSRNMPPGDQLFVEYKPSDPFCTTSISPWRKVMPNPIYYPFNWYNDTIADAWTDSTVGTITSSIEIGPVGCHAAIVYLRIVYISTTGNQTPFATVSNLTYELAPAHLEQVTPYYTGSQCKPVEVTFDIRGICSECSGGFLSDTHYDIDFGDGKDTGFVKPVNTCCHFYGTVTHKYDSTGTFYPSFHVYNFYGGGYDTLELTIYPNPSSVITTTGSTTFCNGDSVLLNTLAGANRSYQWLKGNNPIAGATQSSYTATVGGSYKVTVTNTITQCAKTTATSKVVTVNALPAANITPQGPTTFCNGDHVVLKANAGTSLNYKWKKDGLFIPGAATKNYTAFAGGIYKVQVTDANGCKKTSAGITVSIPCREAGKLVTASADNEIRIYPNPSGGTFQIQSDERINQLIVTNLSGQVILQHTNVDNGDAAIEIDISNQAKGIYLLQLTTDKEVYNRKIILE